MKTNTQIKADEWIIRPMVGLLNILVILVGKILRIDHSLKDKKFKTIAVCKYKGMGSIIQATPLIKALKENYPGAKIIFVTTPANKGILSKINNVDQVITLNDQSFWKLLFSVPIFILKLQRSKIDVYIDLEVYSNFSTLVAICSLATNRLGFYLQSKHYRLGNYTHMMYYNTRSPIMETYLQFARLCNCNISTDELLPLQADTIEAEINGIIFNFKKEQYIVINPNASDLRLERRWGHKNYAALINQLTEKYPLYKIVLVGAPNEKTYVDKVLKTTKSTNIINAAGKTSLDGLIGIIKNASLMITNDSGPMHIAFACQTPTVALFGPCSPSQYGIHKINYNIYKNVYCSPCIHDFATPPCRGHNICMKLIETKDVLTAVESKLQNNHSPDILNAPIIYQANDFTVGTLNRKQEIL